MEFIGVLLFFIGFVLLINAAWLQGKCEATDAGVLNAIVGVLGVGTSVYIGFVAHNAPLSAGLLLFAITYIWVAVNALRGAKDQRAFGLYSLLVALATIPFAYKTSLANDPVFAFEWLCYGLTWFLFFLLFYKGKAAIMKTVIFMVYLVGLEAVITGWSMMYGYWPYIK